MATNSRVQRRRPKAKLIGADSNIFNVMGIASRALKQAGRFDEATEMIQRCRDSHDYNKALMIVTEYVDPV